MTTERRLATCVACQRKTVVGRRPLCGVDGQSIGQHIHMTGCPEGYFHGPSDPGEQPPAPSETDPRVSELRNAISDNELWGDKLEAWCARHGVDKAVQLLEQITGIPCGCNWRKRALNWIHQKLRGG